MSSRQAAKAKGTTASSLADPPGELGGFLKEQRAAVDALLPSLLPQPVGEDDRVRAAMAYSLLAPGKRMRPLLALAVSSIFGGEPARALPAACTLEMVHAASLILDDLPCMDGASIRRGRPATHVAYGEATSILAAVALLNHAYGVIAGIDAEAGLRDRIRAALARRLSEAIGTGGVIGGQQADLAGAGRSVSLRELEFVHSHKTGSLFIASAEVGALLMGVSDGDLLALENYAKNLGLAFQITDDILDAEGSVASTGKDVGRDAERTTFVTLCGVDGARRLAVELVEAAVAHLDRFGRRSRLLRELASFVARRDR